MKKQQHLLAENNKDNDNDIEFDFDPEYHEHNLMYYSFQHPNYMKIPETQRKKAKDKDKDNLKKPSSARSDKNKESIIPNHPKTMVLGSMLAALCYKFVECYKQVLFQINKNPNITKYALEQLSEILSLFMLYGIDFEHKEFQHV